MIVQHDATQRERVVRAAAQGSRQATRALTRLELSDSESQAILDAADRLTHEYMPEKVRTMNEDGWVINMSARSEEGGVAAVYAPPATRHELLHHLISIVDNDELPESVRGSRWVSHPLIRLVTLEDRTLLVGRALKAASHEYVHDDIESPEFDPLSNVHDPVDTEAWLQACGLTALGIVEQLEPDRVKSELTALKPSAIGHARPWVRRAALEVLGRVPSITPEVELDPLATDAAPMVRAEALKATRARRPDRFTSILETAADSPSVEVRATALALAKAAAETAVVEQIAEGDEDAFLRGLAAMNRRAA